MVSYAQRMVYVLKKSNVWNKLFSKKEQILLFCLVLLGIIIRFVIVKETQLYRDEVYDFESARIYSFKDIFFYKYWDIFHPPLYFLFLKAWLFLGNDPFILRLPSLIVSSMVLFLIPILAKNILPRSNIFPFILLFFFSFSRTQSSIGIMVRQYSFEILFMILSLTVFFGILNAKHVGKRTFLLFTLANVFVFFGDYSGLWLIGSYFLYGIISLFQIKSDRKKHYVELLHSLINSTIVFLLWAIIFFIKELPGALKVVHGGYESIDFSAWQVFLFNLPFFIGTPMGKLHIAYTTVMVLPAVLGIFSLLKKEKTTAIFILILFVVPIAASLFISSFFFKIFINRNLIVANIAFIIGLALCISHILENRIMVMQVIGGFFIIIWGMYFFHDFPGLYYVENYDWIKISKTLHKISEGKPVYILSFSPSYMYHPVYYYSSILKFNTPYTVVEYGNYFAKPKKDDAIVFMKFMTEPSPQIPFNTLIIHSTSEELKCRLDGGFTAPFLYFTVCKKY